MHPAIQSGNVAVVTGGASGIGFAAAAKLAGMGLKVCVADLAGDMLDSTPERLVLAGASPRDVLTVATDVSDVAQLKALEAKVTETFGPVSLLMNNAGIQPGSSILDEDGTWERVIDVNMWGIIRSSQVFAPAMIASGAPGLIVNTGSKQGITTPPGDPAYNVSKAGVKVFTEALQHDLRNREGCALEARLFVPGFVYTPLTAGDRTEKPAGAWTPEQTVDFLFRSIAAGDFYILCPDNDVDRDMDEKRIFWAAADLVENRPPLSRWHPDYADIFAEWMKG